MAKSSSSSLMLYGLAVVVALGLLVFAVMRGAGPGEHDTFAQCLTDKGVKMYGAWWCPHCTKQKALFGSSFEKVTYIECSPNGTRTMSQECKDAGIQGYPTWEFADGTRLSGERTFKELADRSGCSATDVETEADSAAATTAPTEGQK